VQVGVLAGRFQHPPPGENEVVRRDRIAVAPFRLGAEVKCETRLSALTSAVLATPGIGSSVWP
jgi:hypothetical protein